jgi:hypothetical protein
MMTEMVFPGLRLRAPTFGVMSGTEWSLRIHSFRSLFSQDDGTGVNP